MTLPSFGEAIRVAIIGASGGIGSALADELESCPSVARIFRLSRSPIGTTGDRSSHLRLDLEDETSIAKAADTIQNEVEAIDLVIVATGLLHSERAGIRPEKTFRALSAETMMATLQANTIGPALVAKHFLPLLAKDRKVVFAALSARVGSIEDNRLGGWHSYRASKAALNMLIKTFSIELARQRPLALCVGLHPGTVDTGLSQPFQRNVESDALFSPKTSACHMLSVLDELSCDQSGSVFAWDGKLIAP